jgi:hypothetical protein
MRHDVCMVDVVAAELDLSPSRGRRRRCSAGRWPPGCRAWFTADETYGQAKWLQAWLEDRDVSYVMAIRCSDTLTTPAAGVSEECIQQVNACALHCGSVPSWFLE